MSWLIDLGNTRLKWVQRHPDGSLGEVLALSHAEASFVECLTQTVAQVPPGEAVWLASVAPTWLTQQVVSVLSAQKITVKRIVVETPCAGLQLGYDRPEQLGVDRFLGLLGALAYGEMPSLVVSIGSALTLDVLDAKGQHRGGLIAPTPTHQQQALAERFPTLVSAATSTAEFASNTHEGIASGCMGSTAGLIERSHRHAAALLGCSPRVLLTGGGAAAVLPYVDVPCQHVPLLTLQGMGHYLDAQVSRT